MNTMTRADCQAPEVLRIHHFTIRCSKAELDAVRAFYCEVLSMRPGPRPEFDFPGHWLYLADKVVLHLAAIVGDSGVEANAERGGSGFDHVSLHCTGLDATRTRLEALAIPFEELPVPGWPLRQIFLRDPVGSKIELTFELTA